VDETRGTLTISEVRAGIDLKQVGADMHRLIAELYPVCRSITGEGFRRTLQLIGDRIPLDVFEVPSGTPVFDWVVPREWNIRDAYVKNVHGDRVVDFRRSNLHVMSYSRPVSQRMRFSELKNHLMTLPDRPRWIPYRTSYYHDAWGFCVSHQHLLEIERAGDVEYEVVIDSTLSDGSLTYGECYLAGDSSHEVLISCHACHPSLCNDNLSGLALSTRLATVLRGVSLRYSYRFLFIPATIGSITWLATHEDHLPLIKHGLVVTGVGDPGKITYKRSRQGDAMIDKAASHVLRHSGSDHAIIDFFPYGYDERQFCSPGFDLPVGCLMRTPHGQYPEYHTSADDLNFVRAEYLADSFAQCLAVLEILERNKTYLNQNPKGEPQLGKRGLYRSVERSGASQELAMLWVLNLSDGKHSLLDIADRAGMPFEPISSAASALVEHGLLRERVDEPPLR